uniref:Uncharacterized protein n=1 Tax=Arundo donax TaxID=35708 RepID=A0A0A8YJI4_ARUDO
MHQVVDSSYLAFDKTG